MYTYTSQIGTTTRIAQDVGGDLLTAVVIGIGIVMGIAVLLVTVGFVWRKLKKYAVGKGF